MIKRKNTNNFIDSDESKLLNNTTKRDLAIELIKIKDNHTKIFESNIANLKNLKSKLIELKTNIKDGIFSQIKLRYKLLLITEKLADNNVNSEKLTKLSEKSVKDLDGSEKMSIKSKIANEKLINSLIAEVNKTIVDLQNKIKQWKMDRKKYVVKYKYKI